MITESKCEEYSSILFGAILVFLRVGLALLLLRRSLSLFDSARIVRSFNSRFHVIHAPLLPYVFFCVGFPLPWAVIGASLVSLAPKVKNASAAPRYFDSL